MDEKKKIMLRNLPAWPPEPGGAYGSGTEFPVAGEAIITEVVPRDGTSVTFKGIHKGWPHSYFYNAENKKIAEQIQKLIAENIAKSVAGLGELKIEI